MALLSACYFLPICLRAPLQASWVLQERPGAEGGPQRLHMPAFTRCHKKLGTRCRAGLEGLGALVTEAVAGEVEVPEAAVAAERTRQGLRSRARTRASQERRLRIYIRIDMDRDRFKQS